MIVNLALIQHLQFNIPLNHDRKTLTPPSGNATHPKSKCQVCRTFWRMKQKLELRDRGVERAQNLLLIMGSRSYLDSDDGLSDVNKLEKNELLDSGIDQLQIGYGIDDFKFEIEPDFESGNGEDTSHENIADGSGNDNINDNGNGNGNNGDDNEDSEWNSEEFHGVEWWWWWKWQQTRHSHQNYDNIFDLWPVDTAVQVVTNGVKETIKPAVRAIVLGPIMQHLSIQGFLLLLVFGAFVISFLQMFAGLAMVSTGISLAGVAALILGLILRPWSCRDQSKSEDDENDIGES